MINESFEICFLKINRVTTFKCCLFYFLAIKKFTAFPAEFDFKAFKYKKKEYM